MELDSIHTCGVLTFSTRPSLYHLNIPGKCSERIVNSTKSSNPGHPVRAKHASGSEARWPM